MNFGYLILFAIIIGGGIGVIIAAFFLYMVTDEFRWKSFLEWIDAKLDNRATRWIFDTAIGRMINLKTIEAHVRSGNPERAQSIAVREGLIDEAIEIFADIGKFREGAVLARKMGRDEVADALFRHAIDEAMDERRPIQAAEAAEEAGFWEEAVDRMSAFDGRSTRLHAARIAFEHDMPEKAIKIYLEEEALHDGMRVAEEHGMLDFVLDYCEKSNNAILHNLAADAARRAGDTERGISILERHGLLHDAALFARESGLHEQSMELIAKHKKQKAKKKLERLGGLPEDPLWGPGAGKVEKPIVDPFWRPPSPEPEASDPAESERGNAEEDAAPKADEVRMEAVEEDSTPDGDPDETETDDEEGEGLRLE